MGKWSKEDLDYLKLNYLDHNLFPEHFIEHFGKSWKAIQQKVYLLKLDTRRLNKRYSVNESFFKEISSKDKAYFLGWLISDGNVSDKRLNICISNEDEEILQTLLRYINFTGSVRKIYINDFNKKSKVERSILSIYSLRLLADLKKYGIVKNKTFTTFLPEIPEDLTPHLIRGIFDGDGCITKNKIENYSFFITGTFELLDKIQDVLVKNCELKKNKLIKHRNNSINGIYSLSYGGNKQIMRIYDYLYKDCVDLHLKRKKLKFEELCNKYKVIK